MDNNQQVEAHDVNNTAKYSTYHPKKMMTDIYNSFTNDYHHFENDMQHLYDKQKNQKMFNWILLLIIIIIIIIILFYVWKNSHRE